MHSATLKRQFGICHYALNKIVDSMTNADSLKSPEPAGNCANWVLGHIVLTRNKALPLFGMEPLFPAESFERYRQGSPPLTDSSEAVPFEQLVGAYEELQVALMDGLEKADPELLAGKAPSSPRGDPKETVGSLLAGIAFHESYHVGQISLLRRMADKAGAVG